MSEKRTLFCIKYSNGNPCGVGVSRKTLRSSTFGCNYSDLLVVAIYINEWLG